MTNKVHPQEIEGTDQLDGDVDYETALADPAAFYPDPEAVLADADLSHEQKQRFLKEWLQDLTDRKAADGEGMAPTDGNQDASEAELLNRVQACLARLEGEHSPNGARGRTFWKRMFGT
jgi:hypothetical protein